MNKWGYRFESNLARAAASYPDVSLLMKICAQRKAGTRERARLLPIVPYASLVTKKRFHSSSRSAKNEAPGEEAARVDTAQSLAPKQENKKTKQNKKTKKSCVKLECY